MTVESKNIPAIFAHIELNDGYRYLCILAGGAVAIHCPGQNVSFTDEGYAVRGCPPPLSWCQMRVGEVAPKTPRAIRLRIAAVLHEGLLLQHKLTAGGAA